MEDPRASKRPRLDNGVPASGSALAAILFGRSGPLPHARSDCPHWVFRPSVDDESHWVNKNVCDLCFCLVCDRRVAECPTWPVHCMAYFDGPEWRDLRIRTRDAVRVLPVPVSLVPSRVRSNKSMQRFLLNETQEGGHATNGLGNASAHRVALSNTGAACAEEVIDLNVEKDVSEKNGSCLHSAPVETASQPQSQERQEKQDAQAAEKDRNSSSSKAVRLSALESPLSLQIRANHQNTSPVRSLPAPVNPGSHHDRDISLGATASAPTRANSDGNRVASALQKSAGLVVQSAKGSDGGRDSVRYTAPFRRFGDRFVASKSEPCLAANVSSVVPSSSISVGAKRPRHLENEAPGDKFILPKRVDLDRPLERQNKILNRRTRYWKAVSRNRTTVSTDTRARPGSNDGFSSNLHAREVDVLQSKWVVGQLLPASHLRSRLARSQGPRPQANALPRRIFVGTIDLWRPYCSHMSAKSMSHPLGWSDKDGVSFCRPTDVQVPGMKHRHVRVLAREMGLDFSNCRLLGDYGYVYILERCSTDVQEWLLNKSSYAWDDKSDMSMDVLDGLVRSIDRKDLEVRWELLHHTVSDNERKAFAHIHDEMQTWDSETLGRVIKDQLDWLNKRHKRLQSLPKFDTSNCCVLRASIYVTPNALGSNMVTAAKVCADSSHYAYMKPLDGGSCLAERSGTPKKGPHPWSDAEMRVKHDNAGITAVFAALKPVRDCRVQDQSTPSCAEETRQTPRSANAPSPFQSLCRTYKPGLDNSTRKEANELVTHLKDLSFEQAMDSENKASIDAILSSKRFVVSDGYSRATRQPVGIGLSLRLYQRESLAWMMDQERKKSISEPFWTKISGKTVTGDDTDLYYSPLTGSLTRYPPPPVVGGVLAEEMGLGKTLIMTSLIVSTLDDARQWRWRLLDSPIFGNLMPSHGTLIVCPVSLLKQWEQELKTTVRMPLKVLLWYGPSRSQVLDVITSFDVVLTTYGILSQRKEYYEALTKIKWHRLVIDESTYLRGGANTCSTVLSEQLVSSRRWAVSGTPFGNDFRTFLGTMRFLGVVPFSNSQHFEKLSRVATESADKLTEMEDFHLIPQLSYILKNLMIRHLKDQDFRGQTLVELPPATGRYVGVQLNAEERTLYDAMESNAKTKAARYLRSEKSTGSNIIALRSMMIPLRVMADGVQPEIKSPASSGPGKKEENIMPSALSKVKVEKKSLGSSKIRQLLRDVQTYRAADANSKFVVFTEFRSVKDEIQTTLKNHGLEVLTLDGNMSAGRRGKMIRMFAEDADAAVLVLSMRLGACGLTLTMANVVVLFEAGLDMATELQAVNRIHRIGQTRQVETLTYVAEGTIDERMTDVRKRRGQPRVVGESVEVGQKEDLSTAEVYRVLFDYTRP